MRVGTMYYCDQLRVNIHRTPQQTWIAFLTSGANGGSSHVYLVIKVEYPPLFEAISMGCHLNFPDIPWRLKSILEVNPSRQIPSVAPSASRKSNTSALTDIEPSLRRSKKINDLMYQYPLVIQSYGNHDPLIYDSNGPITSYHYQPIIHDIGWRAVTNTQCNLQKTCAQPGESLEKSHKRSVQASWNSISVYPLAMKHGVLENGPSKSVIFLSKPPFVEDFPLPFCHV